MEANFWHDLWDKNDTGWHLEDANPLLLNNFSQLNLNKQDRILVPLCGKTVDIKWFLEHNYKVVGVELNEKAIKELFEYLELQPTITQLDSFVHYSAKNIDIFVGDVFKLDKTLLGKVDLVYDRGAIVALPDEMRKKYTSLLKEITNNAVQLVITFDYEQSKMDGPPFSVDKVMMDSYYADSYTISILETIVVDFFDFDVNEHIWLLEN